MAHRTILITGAGRGIGRAVALRFARAGDNVALAARSMAELEETANEARSQGAQALVIAADIASESAAIGAVNAAVARFGGLDVLVNAAGVAPFGPAHEMTTAEFDAMMAVNARGVFLMCREVWPVMSGRGGGSIVNVSSMAARNPFPGLAAYGGSKAFVETLTRGLATEGRSAKIRVFGVAPGAVKTRMLLDLFPDFPEDQMLQPDDAAGLIEWLCDPRCQYCSGQTLTINRDA